MKTLLAVATLTLSLAGAGCQNETAAAPVNLTPPPNEVWITPKQLRESTIQTAPVANHEVGNSIATTGRVTFSDVDVAHVFPPVTGRVTSILAAPGDAVHRGAALAVIQSPDIASAVSDLQKADADLASAEQEYDRQKELFDAHAAAARDFEAADANLRKARAERDRAAQKSELLGNGGRTSVRPGGPKRALHADAFTLTSPIDGEVVARNVSLAMEVQGQYSGGTAPELFTVGNIDRVRVLADVFEIDLPRLRIGAPVKVNVVAYPDRTFEGRIDWISGALDPATRTAKVRCTIENRDHALLPEMYATVAVTTDSHPKLAIPRSAVVRLGDDMVVFVDKGTTSNGLRRFERRIVGVDDAQADTYVPVVRGLAPGENVVSSGAVILSGAAQ